MNIYIHYYIYFIYNSRPALNNFSMIITAELSAEHDKIWWQALLLCQPVAGPVVSKRIADY